MVLWYEYEYESWLRRKSFHSFTDSRYKSIQDTRHKIQYVLTNIPRVIEDTFSHFWPGGFFSRYSRWITTQDQIQFWSHLMWILQFRELFNTSHLLMQIACRNSLASKLGRAADTFVTNSSRRMLKMLLMLLMLLALFRLKNESIWKIKKKKRNKKRFM